MGHKTPSKIRVKYDRRSRRLSQLGNHSTKAGVQIERFGLVEREPAGFQGVGGGAGGCDGGFKEKTEVEMQVLRFAPAGGDGVDIDIVEAAGNAVEIDADFLPSLAAG